MLILGGVSFRHPGQSLPLWQGVNLVVNPGERVLITGPSGSGKSTLLAAAAGLIPDQIPGKLEGHWELGFQNPALVLQNPETQMIAPTVLEEVAFPLENLGWDENRIIMTVREILHRLGLRSLENRKMISLSGGEAQRVALAAALVQGPDILFLDEPTSYLDPRGVRDFFRLLKELSPSTALFLVEHRWAEAADLVTARYELGPDGLEEKSLALGTPRVFYPSPKKILEGRKEPPLLEIEGLGFSYPGENTLFHNLNGQFYSGEITAVTGASGTGKSTVLKLMAGVLSPSMGKLLIQGSEFPRLKHRRLWEKLIYIPQNPEHFFLKNTVKDEWKLGDNSTEEKKRVIKELGLEHLEEDRHPCSLSEGEKRRLTLGLGLYESRPILLLDEPTYGLDEAAFLHLAGDLIRLRDAGRCIILVTHSPELVGLCADKVLNLPSGEWSRPARIDNEEVCLAR